MLRGEFEMSTLGFSWDHLVTSQEVRGHGLMPGLEC